MQVLPKTSTCAAFTGFRGLANKIIQNFSKIWKKLITQTFSYIACFHVRDKTDFLSCCDDLNLLWFSFFISLKDNTTFETLMPQARLWQVIISGADDKGRHNPRDVTLVIAVSAGSHTSLREWVELSHDQQDLRCSKTDDCSDYLHFSQAESFELCL